MSRALKAIETDFAGLDAHFDKVITPNLDALEDHRKQRHKLSKLVFGAMVFLVMPICMYFFWKYKFDIIWFGMIFFSYLMINAAIMLGDGIADKVTSNVRIEAKEVLLNGVADHLGWSFNAHPENPSIMKFLKDKRMFVGMRRERYEDALQGEALRHKFTITEADMLSNLKIRDEYIFTFRGVILSIDFPKQIFGTTILRLKDKRHEWRTLKDFKKIGFASPKFEAKYEVYGTDPTESYYLFSPDVMATFLDVATALGGKMIACVYWEGTLNLMITGKNRYEVKRANRAFATKKRLNKLKQEIASVYHVIEKTEYYLTHRNPRDFQG